MSIHWMPTEWPKSEVLANRGAEAFRQQHITKVRLKQGEITPCEET